ncbi:DNA-binding transcriptional regulator [Ruegeria sp. EL01]|uniref:helix-turn-helix domain-containing protein n=1 Tax=Ruegeria sp. EL01 TaxID=2107578 RepID=UPI001C1F8928|nr:helix-turn-helix domain-containing protein [Ruegeria sp. EL01]
MTGPDPCLVPVDPAQSNRSDTNSEPVATPLEVREKAGLTAAEMAELIGMSEIGYKLWESGARRPGGPAYKLLALLDAHPKETVARLRQHG